MACTSALATRVSGLIGNQLVGCPSAASDACFGAATYQQRAVAYIQSLLDVGGLITDLKLIQNYALACIYFATGGDAWSNANTNGWLSGSDPCKAWEGIDCNFDLQVTSIDLHENNLVGDFPCEVALLSADHPVQAGFLEVLTISSNYLTNTNDPELQWIGGLGSKMGTYLRMPTALAKLPKSIFLTFTSLNSSL